jgi:hypothetical protein
MDPEHTYLLVIDDKNNFLFYKTTLLMNSSQKCTCYVLVTNEKYEKVIISDLLT